MFLVLIPLLFLVACTATPGPDKTASGAILGAAWGAGAGAVVGNQVSAPDAGAGIGAGIGAVGGMLAGVGLDVAEGTQLRQQRELEALKVKTAINQRGLLSLQDTLDRKQGLSTKGVIETIQFDSGKASIHIGSASRLEELSKSLKKIPFGKIAVHGYADDEGNAELNQRLSNARAKTITTFLANHGISLSQINMYAHGSSMPLASNKTEVGKQLNRRVEIVLE